MRFFPSARCSASAASFTLFRGTYYAWTPTGALSFCTRIGRPSKRLPLLTKRIGPISATPIGSTGSTAITVCCRNGMRRKEEEDRGLPGRLPNKEGIDARHVVTGRSDRFAFGGVAFLAI